uniref:Uncharacterized protein n=1 Tax=Anguilla anguilla TaxID=7936 RepID=A0A0E9WTX8_ANGAN
MLHRGSVGGSKCISLSPVVTFFVTYVSHQNENCLVMSRPTFPLSIANLLPSPCTLFNSCLKTIIIMKYTNVYL